MIVMYHRMHRLKSFTSLRLKMCTFWVFNSAIRSSKQGLLTVCALFAACFMHSLSIQRQRRFVLFLCTTAVWQFAINEYPMLCYVSAIVQWQNQWTNLCCTLRNHSWSFKQYFVLPGCNLWTRKANTAAQHGVFFQLSTESECMAECLTSSSCVAIDFSPDRCMLHNNADDLATSYYAPGVTQSVLNRNCLISSPFSTQSPDTTTTSVRSTITGM